MSDYKVADVSSIRESLMNIDWYFEFGDLEPNLMVDKFTEIILSIIADNVPNRVITVNEKDPPWITKEVKTAIRHKHGIYNKYIKSGSKQENWEQVKKIVRNQTTHLIDDAKENYFKSLGEKLTDPDTGIKACWQSTDKQKKLQEKIYEHCFTSGKRYLCYKCPHKNNDFQLFLC